ncbi:MAG: DUF2125 domain-containing protein [Emcibacteraceae bacterium]|nr:DUF2125 domain-containing protein [Emcibacteraceae bacterium]
MRARFLLAFTLLLIVGYSLFWFQLAKKVEKNTLDWIVNSESRLNGTKFYVNDLSLSGFPYKIVIKASSLTASIPSGRFSTDPLLISIPEVAVVFQPWKPNHAIIIADYFNVEFSLFNEQKTNMAFDKVKSSIILDPVTNHLNNLSIVAESISWYYGDEIKINESPAVEDVEFHLRRSVLLQNDYDLPVNSSVFFKASNFKINELSSTGFGVDENELRIDAQLHANKHPEYNVVELSKWRDEGGTISIKKFEYVTKDLVLSLTGDVTLDEQLKPLGAFNANILSDGSLLNNLPKGLMNLQPKDPIPPGQTANQEVSLSIRMQNGGLYLGPLMLMELWSVVK